MLRAEWRTGDRTPAWDELWRRLLADVLSDGDELAAVAVQEKADGQSRNGSGDE